MKRTLALLLVAIMAITCSLAALSVSADETVYTDKVNLLPANESEISIAGGTPIYTLSEGKLSLTRAEESSVAWPSVKYTVNKEVDLTATPFLHMNFETSGVGDRGVNGHIHYTVDGGDEVEVQLSAIGGNGVDDFRDTADMYIDLADYLDITGKITITYIDLSVYGGIGETITWNALALAKEGADEDNTTTSSEGDDTTTSSEGDDTTTSSEGDDTTTSSEESSKVPPTGDSGIILFAALGVLALAGVAVTVKARH